MLCYDIINISKGIDLAKSNNSKECMICHYWSFSHGFKFQDSVWNVCHNITISGVSISNIYTFYNVTNIAIITTKTVGYRFVTDNITKSEAIFFSLLKTVFILVYIKWLVVNIVWTFINLQK